MALAKRYTPQENSTIHITKGILLYLFTFPLFLSVILALLQTNIKAFILNMLGFLLYVGVLTLAKKGFAQEAHYHASTFAKAPKIPYKTLAGILLGAVTFYCAYLSGSETLLKSLFLSIVATIGYFLYYGSDPKEDKFENLGDISAEFVLNTIKEAKEKLHTIHTHLEKIHDTLLHEKLSEALKQAESILKRIEEDPRNIRVARKFLIVYIDGIVNVTESYTELDEASIDASTKARLHALMDEVQIRFDKELERLKSNHLFHLDVSIDTLKAQVNH